LAIAGEGTRVCDAQTGAELLRLESRSLVQVVAFSADDGWLLTAETDNFARLWS